MPLRRRNRGAFAVRRDALRILWSEVVRTRDHFTCRRCGRTKAQGYQIDAAHVLGVGSHPNLKYLSANGISLCTIPCHRWYDTHKSSDRDGEADHWVRKSIGEEAYTRLLVEAKIAGKPNKFLSRLVLREELKQLKAAAREYGV